MSEFRTIGSFAKQLKRVNESNSSCADVYSVTKYDGFVRSLDYFKKQVFSRDLSSYKIVKKGEFAYSTIHLDEGALGLLSDEEALISPMYTTFEVDASVERQYLAYLLKSPNLINQYGLIGQGSVNRRKSVPFSSLAELEVFIPPLPEQKKIAEILSGIDRQILSVKSEIQQARRISTAVTKELIGSIQDESLPLSEVAINHDSIRVPIKSEERALRNGPYRYYGASGIIDTIDDFLFDGDYILIGEDGANIIDRNKPLAFKVSGKFWVNNHAHIIQPRESCDINFLTYYLESLDYTGIASGSAQPKITRSALDAIQVPLPPLEVQKKIGSVIESTIGVATTAEKKEKKLIDLKQALSSELLSGRKRVTI
jgi:type I restriction enzyme S subunit